MPFFKRSHQSQPQQPQLQSFILEPILTPSGLIDGGDDGVLTADLTSDLGFPSAEAPSSSVEVLEADEVNITTPDLPEASDYLLDDPLPYIEPSFDGWQYEGGVFTVGDDGLVGIDFLFDGGKYKSELAIFSLDGMEAFDTPEAFIQEAARRALDSSDLGHVVISDRLEGAKFEGLGNLGEARNWNSGEYLGVKNFQMRAGDRFALLLVPNGTVQEVFDNPTIGGSKEPIFSLATANPNDPFHFGQIADVTGDGNTFVLEDTRPGSRWFDQDYNDLIFQVRGARGDAPYMGDLLDPTLEWRDSDLGQALIEYAKAYITPENNSLQDLWTEPLPELPGLETETSPLPWPSPTTPYFQFPAESQPLVGIIDTGFAANNPDLDYSNITLGRDWIDGDDNPLLSAGEGNEHGTHVLGIIAAQQDNGIGIDGINPDAPLWLGRAVGSGQWANSLVEFVDAAVESGQPNAVVNLSLDLTQIDAGGEVFTRYEFTPMERAAIEYARQNNVLLVVAAGNDGGVMSALGQASQEFDNIITVGAAEQFDPNTSAWKGADRADYSSYGHGLDLMAYGGTSENPHLSLMGDDLGGMAGTSVATAKVTGAVSQVWAANPALSYRQVIELLKQTATDLGEPGFDSATGAGLLNIMAAVQLAKATKPEQKYNFLDLSDDFPDDEMSTNLDVVFESHFPGFSNVSATSEINLDDFTEEERTAYEEAIKEITQGLNQYLAYAGQKITLEYADAELETKLEAMTSLMDILDEETLEALLTAQRLLEESGFDSSFDIEEAALASNFGDLNFTQAGFVVAERPVAVAVPAFSAQVMNVGYVSSVGFLRIRSGPGTNFVEVGRKYPGETVTFDAFQNNGAWVPDPFMPGGGSSRWYKIAGTNQWMSALYLNKTPEQAAQERAHQEAIKRAEAEARRVQEEAQRAEAEARRLAEEAQRQLEEEMRRIQQEAILRAVAAQENANYWKTQNNSSSPSQKHIDYERFAKKKQFGEYSVDRIFRDEKTGLDAIGLIDKNGNKPPVLVFAGSNEWKDWMANTNPFGIGSDQYRTSKYEIGNWLKEKARNGQKVDVTGYSLGGVLAQLTTLDYHQFIGETVTFSSPGVGSLDGAKFYSGEANVTHYFAQADLLARWFGQDLIPGSMIEMRFTNENWLNLSWLEKHHTEIILHDSEVICYPVTAHKISGFINEYNHSISRLIPEGIRMVFGTPVYLGSKIVDLASNTFLSFSDSVGSFVNESILALQNKAQQAKEVAEAMAAKAKSAYQAAKGQVTKAKEAYSQFKEETKRRVNETVQFSKQAVQKAVEKAAQIAKNTTAKVSQAVSQFAKGAVNTAKKVINAGKKIVNNVINAGKAVVNNIINTGKQLANTVKNTVNAGVKLVSTAANNLKKAGSNAVNNAAKGFNKLKSVLGF